MSTIQAKALPKSLNQLIKEGCSLRDHMLRIEGLEAIPLAKALLPFDREEDFSKISDDDIEALNEAFQAAVDETQRLVDGQTLDDILAGKSPLIGPIGRKAKFGRLCNNAAQTGIAILLVFTALYYSSWVNQSAKMIVQAEEFLTFDNTEITNGLIELEDLYKQTAAETGTAGNAIISEYLNRTKLLEQQYILEVTVPSQLQLLIGNFNPVAEKLNDIRADYCRDEDRATWNMVRYFIDCTPFRAPLSAPVDALTINKGEVYAAISGDARMASFAASGPQNVLRQKIRILEDDRIDLMAEAGRVPLNRYRDTRFLVLASLESVLLRLDIARIWLLPIVFGALGSIVYSMSCMLKTNVSNHAFLYAMTRMIFGGLAALTLSMLIVPSNVVTVGTDLNRPLIYLIAFIFGFSIETFVNVLNQLNHYVLQSTTFGKNTNS